MNNVIIRQRACFSFATCMIASKPTGTSVMLTETEALVFHSHTYDKMFRAGHWLCQNSPGKQKVHQESVRPSWEKTSWVLGTRMVRYIMWDFHSWRHLRNCLLFLQLAFMCSYIDRKKPLILTRTEIHVLYLHELELTSWAFHLDIFAFAVSSSKVLKYYPLDDEVKLVYSHMKITNLQESLLEISKS